ncbi:twin-arginine translocase subunit TatC [Mammaliicoccus sciuri]|uniref:twin-arginine translocase subunit TatC n=1 Tax=Mammaliicoccus sciuri TaxID=1296 RepID=UPI0034DCD6C1
MDKDNLTFVEHLEELRGRIMIIAYFLVGGLIVGFFVAKPVIFYITNDDFTQTLELNAFRITDPLTIYITMIIVIAFIIVSPVILYELWAFISPGLHPKEQKVTLSYVPFSLILFVGGLLFSYFVIFPYLISFTMGLADDMGIKQTDLVLKSIYQMFKFTIPFGFVFIQILLLFLTRLGIFKPMFLKKNRKYAYFILLVVAALIAPQNLYTHMLFTLPMILIYEI